MSSSPAPGPVDLLRCVAALVAIPSVSHGERELADHLEAQLAGAAHLELHRIGSNLVARTRLGRRVRLIVAGHLDTVPPAGNEEPVVEGDRLRGLGAADMKGGLAVMAHLATSLPEPAVDVTYVFYEGEEVEHVHNGLGRLERERPDLLEADAAVLAEPTGAVVEAGCQGTLRLVVALAGRRAHTARPWKGINAIHRLAPILAAVAALPAREPVLRGCTYREALQAVGIEGGVAGNVVPDSARLVLNHRFAPDRTPQEARAWLEELLAPHLGPGDVLELADSAAGAPPGLDHPLLQSLVAATGQAPRAKLGWTDVARFAARGVPAVNFGPGDPAVAHSPGEWVDREQLDAVAAALARLLSEG